MQATETYTDLPVQPGTPYRTIVGNNPVNLFDPFGLFDIEACRDRDCLINRYEEIHKPTGVTDVDTRWNWFRIGEWLSFKALIASLNAIGAGTGSKTFIIGQDHYLEQWAIYDCLVLYCMDTLERKELSCKKKIGSEYWITLRSEDITRTVSFDPDLLID